MLEKPDLPDQLIISRLQAEYGLEVTRLTFLPLGYDMHTSVYRVETRNGRQFFLKLRQDPFDPIIVEVPKFLASLPVHAIISPIETMHNRLFGSLDTEHGMIHLILYPFTPGSDGYQVRLTDAHWVELGQTFRSIHDIQLPPGLAHRIPSEHFSPEWRERVKGYLLHLDQGNFVDPIARKLSVFLQDKWYEINHIVTRAEQLAARLQKKTRDFVLCHSDAHPGNYLIADSGELYLVDWDNPILAPRERDLMFFGSGMSGDFPGGREEILFYQGYGKITINQEALAYYRYERIIQDIAEFCTQIFSTTSGGDDRLQSYTYLVSSFLPGHEVEAALKTDQR